MKHIKKPKESEEKEKEKEKGKEKEKEKEDFERVIKEDTERVIKEDTERITKEPKEIEIICTDAAIQSILKDKDTLRREIEVNKRFVTFVSEFR